MERQTSGYDESANYFEFLEAGAYGDTALI
jgi:hypothetical protein